MNSHFERFEAVDGMGDAEERIIPAKEQKRLISKLQNNSITTQEKDILISSLYNLVIRISRSFASRFPDRSLEDLIEDGLLNLWLRLPTYQPDRSTPSTFTHIVVSTAFCKELKRLQRKSLRRSIDSSKDQNNNSKKEINIPMMSLSNFQDSEGQEYEPDALGVEDIDREFAESSMDFESMMLKMYQNVCRSVQEYKILNHLLNIKLLPNFGGGRRRKSLNKIAQIVDVKMSQVEKVADRVKPWIDKHDFISLLFGQQFQPPMPHYIFDKKTLDEYFKDHDGEDIWSLLNGNS